MVMRPLEWLKYRWSDFGKHLLPFSTLLGLNFMSYATPWNIDNKFLTMYMYNMTGMYGLESVENGIVL